jgi:hypothetical protein
MLVPQPAAVHRNSPYDPKPRAYRYLERDHDPAGPRYSGSDLDQMMFEPDDVDLPDE